MHSSSKRTTRTSALSRSPWTGRKVTGGDDGDARVVTDMATAQMVRFVGLHGSYTTRSIQASHQAKGPLATLELKWKIAPY
jgi:hypothetical protein